MNELWQNLIVLCALLAAAGYLTRLAWQSITLRRAAACGSCPSCPTSAEGPQVVEIGALPASSNSRPVDSQTAQHS